MISILHLRLLLHRAGVLDNTTSFYAAMAAIGSLDKGFRLGWRRLRAAVAKFWVCSSGPALIANQNPGLKLVFSRRNLKPCSCTTSPRTGSSNEGASAPS